jgi:hypothetical protein
MVSSGISVDNGRHNAILAHVLTGCPAQIGTRLRVEGDLFHFLKSYLVGVFGLKKRSEG